MRAHLFVNLLSNYLLNSSVDLMLTSTASMKKYDILGNIKVKQPWILSGALD